MPIASLNFSGDAAVGQKLGQALAALHTIFGPASRETFGSTEFEWRLHETPHLRIERVSTDCLRLTFHSLKGPTDLTAMQDFLSALQGAPAHASWDPHRRAAMRSISS